MVMGYCVSAETIMGIWQIGQGIRKEIYAFITSQWFFTQTVLHRECIDLGAADGWYVL